MKTDDMMDAIGQIDLKYVQEAELYQGDWNKKEGRKVIYRRWKRLLPVAACLTLAIGAGTYGLLRNGADADSMTGSSLESADMESAEEAAVTSQYDATATENEIKVNDVSEILYACYDVSEPGQKEYYSVNQLEDYYGTRIVPDTLPKDLMMDVSVVGDLRLEDNQNDEENEAEEATVYESADEVAVTGYSTDYCVGYDASGKVVDDNNEICWENAEGTRTLKIAARTVNAGEVISFDGEMETSQIMGQEVLVAHLLDDDDKERYIAIYEKDGVTVTVQTTGMMQVELENILVNLLQ